MKKLLIAFLAFSMVVPSFVSCKKDDTSSSEEKKEEEKKPSKKEDYPFPEIEKNPVVDYTKWEIKDGKFYLDGKWVFLKIGKPLINYADANSVNALKNNLDTYKSMYYNCLELNCYWHHFDTDGDGVPDKSLEPLRDLVEAIYNKGMYPCISVETYAVGGGNMPAGFFTKYPDAKAIALDGKDVTDTEYGFGSQVVSIFHQAYRDNVHTYIKAIASGINTKHVLWFETTVEPQYMGAIPLCYSESARTEYNKWRAEKGITDASSAMPASYPIDASFANNTTWNKFRAQFLAKWVNEDAAAWRSVAGEKAYVAVDYLETSGSEMKYRNGDSDEFLRNLSCPTIIQVNWHTVNGKPHKAAYERVRKIMKETGRNWAIAEHMTMNGDDFAGYTMSMTETMLEGTLNNGTRLGWEFTNVCFSDADSFCVYDAKHNPKKNMRYVDKWWGYWMTRVKEIEEAASK